MMAQSIVLQAILLVGVILAGLGTVLDVVHLHGLLLLPKPLYHAIG